MDLIRTVTLKCRMSYQNLLRFRKKVRVVLPGVLPAQAGKGLPPVKIELEIA